MNKEELKELAATLNGIADGKAWETMAGPGASWESGEGCALHRVLNGYRIRLKPWSLPAPPDGMKWHRDDWTEEMLPEGWRPLLLDEPREKVDQWTYNHKEGWNIVESYGPAGVLTTDRSSHHRTRRPLPQPDPYAELKAAHAAGKKLQHRCPGESKWSDCSVTDTQQDPYCFVFEPECYRIKPDQQKVPLGPGDVPPGSVLRRSEWSSAWQSLSGAYDRGVSFNGALWEWDDIIDTHQINRSIPLTGKWNSEAWEPCYKLIDTP